MDNETYALGSPNARRLRLGKIPCIVTPGDFFFFRAKMMGKSWEDDGKNDGNNDGTMISEPLEHQNTSKYHCAIKSHKIPLNPIKPHFFMGKSTIMGYAILKYKSSVLAPLSFHTQNHADINQWQSAISGGSLQETIGNFSYETMGFRSNTLVPWWCSQVITATVSCGCSCSSLCTYCIIYMW